MGSRSRKRRSTSEEAPRPRRRVVVGDAAFTPREVEPPRSRSEQRAEMIRAGLEPLAPGERPRALLAAIAVALLFGVGNLVLLVAGYDLQGREDPSAAGVAVFSGIMFVAAAGMWAMRYWAVMGFECLLAITVVYAAASLAVATNARAVVLCVAIIGLSGWLFWKLIRVMARIQMPRRPGR